MNAVPEDLDLLHLPHHVAVIMDGNGRWAKARGLARTEGHKAGEQALFDVLEGALEIGLPCLTVFAFSTENWRRPREEVSFLMNFSQSAIVRRRDELNERGVQIRWIGRQSRLPGHVARQIDEAIKLTRNNDKMVFTVALNYGSRAELADAARAIAVDVAQGRLKPEKVSERSIEARLYDPHLTEVDLLVRTSGEMRISNFLLWQCAYAELYFTETLWPDFNRASLYEAIGDFQARSRRFGAL
ncbi:MAG: polyprenyl diphosphate synthase [Actinomycetota bacterium]